MIAFYFFLYYQSLIHQHRHKLFYSVTTGQKSMFENYNTLMRTILLIHKGSYALLLFITTLLRSNSNQKTLPHKSLLEKFLKNYVKVFCRLIKRMTHTKSQITQNLPVIFISVLILVHQSPNFLALVIGITIYPASQIKNLGFLLNILFSIQYLHHFS